MTMKSALGLLLRGSLAPFGISIVRTTTNKVRGLEPLLDLQYLLGHRRDPVIFDIGANEGETVHDFLDCFPQCHIVAFEPFEGCLHKLRQTFATHPNVRLEGVALGAEKSSGELHLYSGSNMNSLLEMEDSSENLLKNSFTSTGSTCVEIETLDRFCALNTFKRIEILKVDTQGFDLNVLQGAKGLLATHAIKTIFLEVNFIPMYRHQATFIELHSFLSSFGYRLVDFYNQVRHEGHIAWCDALYVAAQQARP
jgi:FkbM family methyltransferase